MNKEPHKTEVISADTLEFTSRLIEHTFKKLGVEVAVVAAYPGLATTRYEIKPAIGIKVSQIVNLVTDLQRELSMELIRVIDPLPGKTNMSLELPNQKP